MKFLAVVAAGFGLWMAGSVDAREYLPVEFPADASGFTSFVMPSKNIECIYTPAGGSKVHKSADGAAELSCDRLQPIYLRFTLTAIGPAVKLIKVDDQSCCGTANKFDYGKSWHAGPFTCESGDTALSCYRNDGHGFEISRTIEKAY